MYHINTFCWCNEYPEWKASCWWWCWHDKKWVDEILKRGRHINKNKFFGLVYNLDISGVQIARASGWSTTSAVPLYNCLSTYTFVSIIVHLYSSSVNRSLPVLTPRLDFLYLLNKLYTSWGICSYLQVTWNHPCTLGVFHTQGGH